MIERLAGLDLGRPCRGSGVLRAHSLSGHLLSCNCPPDPLPPSSPPGAWEPGLHELRARATLGSTRRRGEGVAFPSWLPHPGWLHLPTRGHSSPPPLHSALSSLDSGHISPSLSSLDLGWSWLSSITSPRVLHHRWHLSQSLSIPCK